MKSLKTKIAVSSLIISFIILSLSSIALAQTPAAPTVPISPKDSIVPDPTRITSMADLMVIAVKIVGWIYTVFFVVAALLILFAAFTYLMAGGDPEKVNEAKNRLLYAAIAIVVALLAYSMAHIIKNITG